MSRKANFINRAYNEVTRLVEKLPDGISWDTVLGKVAVLKSMNKSQQAELLIRFRSQGNVMVIDTKRDGEDVTYPVLKHKMFLKNVLDMTNTIGQVDNSNTPGLQTSFAPKRFSPSDAVLKSTPAADVAHNSRSAALAHTCKNAEDLRTQVNDRIKQLDGEGGISPDLAFKGDTMDRAIAKAMPANWGLATERLVVAATAALDTLKKYKEGLTRTKLSNLCVKYHGLTGGDRAMVINTLIKFAGVVDYKSPTSSDSRSATTLLHPDHAKNVVCNKLPDTNASEKAEVEKTITTAKPLNDNVTPGYRLNGFKDDRSMSRADLYQIAMQLHEHICDYLSQPGNEYFLLRSIHSEFPEYSRLATAERDAVSKMILSFNKLHTYRGELTNDSIAYMTQGAYTRMMGLRNNVVSTGDEVVYSTATATKPLDTPTVSNHTKANETPAVTTSTKAFETPAVSTSTIPSAIPALGILGMDPAALQNMASMLQQASVLIETKQVNDMVLEELLPLKVEINENYQVLQENVVTLLDSATSLGLAIEKLNNLLK